eukprot:11193854-Lingulodinium_polyedra.AAC.1
MPKVRRIASGVIALLCVALRCVALRRFAPQRVALPRLASRVAHCALRAARCAQHVPRRV